MKSPINNTNELAERKRRISSIHAGKSYLKLDDETYRSILLKITGKTSCTQCSMLELWNVREEMHRLGYPKRSGKFGKKPNVARSRKATLDKIEALLTDAGRHWNYALKLAKTMFKAEEMDMNIEWLNDEQLRKLLQALIIDANRREARTTVQE